MNRGGGGRVGREGLSQHKHAYIQKHGEASVLECAIQVLTSDMVVWSPYTYLSAILERS